ncbi:MAG: hypothetical protein RLZ98_2884 [Pseudomonadota bacterium]|jgi:pyroglutamyl-peptidase
MTGTGQTILITGFGPFPGVPRNVSGEIALAIGRQAAIHLAAWRTEAAVLETEWGQGLARLRQLLDAHEPDIALHFGVSPFTGGFQIETIAHCSARAVPDAAGCLPADGAIFAAGRDLPSSFPASDIVDRLIGEGLPASLSTDAGRYLCNAALHASLADAASCGRPSLRGFVHIPVELTEETLTFDDAVRGGLAILDVCIAAFGRPTGPV